MIPFQYVDFYDYPRAIAAKYRGKLLLLQSAFDDELDDYPNFYTVYLLPESAETQLKAGSCKFLKEVPLHPVAQIPIGSVCFDPTRRKKFDACILDGLEI
jgi:hypothetical protein